MKKNMDSRIIKDLLDKYFEGATTLKEESYLRQYFSSERLIRSLQILSTLQLLFPKKIDKLIFRNLQKPKIRYSIEIDLWLFLYDCSSSYCNFYIFGLASPQNGAILTIEVNESTMQQIVRLKAEGIYLKLSNDGFVGQIQFLWIKLNEGKKSLLPINKLGNKADRSLKIWSLNIKDMKKKYRSVCGIILPLAVQAHSSR